MSPSRVVRVSAVPLTGNQVTVVRYARLTRMRGTKPDLIHLTDDEPSGTQPSYATLGLDEHSLRQRLSDEADRRQGEMIGVAFRGRGAVMWHEGEISILGPAGERSRELREAVAALLEGAEVSSPRVVLTVDNAAPGAPTVTASGDLVYQEAANYPVYFGPAGHVTLVATSTAGTSGLGRIRFDSLTPAAGWTPSPALPNADVTDPYTQELAVGPGAQSATIDVVARSGAGVESPATQVSLEPDSSPPDVTIQSPAENGITNSTAATVAWAESDLGAGVETRSLQRQRAVVLFPGSCTGVVWEDEGAPSSAGSPAAQSLAAGFCYRWLLAVSDRIGSTTHVESAWVLVDTSPPTADFESPDEGGATASGSSSTVVSWTDEDVASGITERSIRRQAADKVTGACTGVQWADDGLIPDPVSPLFVEDLTPDRCYRWVLGLEDAAGNMVEHVSGVVALDKVTLASPPAQAAFFDVETLEAATGSPGPLSVEFLVDGTVIATDTSTPFTAAWDTTTIDDGPVVVVLRATFSSGPVFESSPIEVTVANQLSPEERVEADAAAARISIDERALRMVYALGAPGSLPSRYHGPLDGDGHASVGLQFLRDWAQVSSATKAEIEAFLNQPWRGAFYATPGGANVGATHPDFPECTLSMENHTGGDVVFCNHDTAGGTFHIRYYLQGGGYGGGVARDDANANGVPDYIDRLSVALEDAWDVYFGLGYSFAPPAFDRIPVQVDALSVGGLVGPGVYPVIQIDNDQPNQGEVYLARHELFHYMQYGYVDIGDLASNDSDHWFWMEATAEWAAHQAQLVGSQQAALDAYYDHIGEYLGRPDLQFNLCECHLFEGVAWIPELRDREYGAFVFAEFLEEWFNDRDVIRDTWDAIAQNQLAEEAIDDVAAANNTTLRQLLTEFAQIVYFMDFSAPERNDWRDRLEQFGIDHPDEYTGPDEYGGPRPARTLVTMLDGPIEDGELWLEEGGFAYVELAPIESGLGQIDVSVSRQDEAIDATLLLLDKSTVAGPLGYPTVCDEIALEFEDNLAQRTVPVNDGCATHAVLMLVHGEPIGGQAASVFWTATFDSGLLSNGTVEVGLNPHGHLIAEGSTPSSSGTLEVGLRYLPTQDEGLSHGCFCEGWGVADVTTNTSGWANEDWGGTGGLELIEFDKIFDTAVSRVRVSDKLEVTHEVRPATGTQFLYEFEVTIQNISSQPADIRYRRTIDWDIDPDPFTEYVTLDAFGGQPVPALAFSSNDGFANPDPLAGPTDDGEVGFFVDAGPYDHGALFDFDFGSLAPGASRTFYLYYGAAPSRGDALSALGIVDAHLYSFGQTYNPDMTVDNSATTFIFAFRDPEAANDSPAIGSLQAAPDLASEPSISNRNRQGD